MWNQPANVMGLANLDQRFEFGSVLAVTQLEPERRPPQQCVPFAVACLPSFGVVPWGRDSRVPRGLTGV